MAYPLLSLPKQLPTWVPLGPADADPLNGHANIDNIEMLDRDELGKYLGALSAGVHAAGQRGSRRGPGVVIMKLPTGPT